MVKDWVRELADKLGFQVGSRTVRGIKVQTAYGVHNDIIFNIMPAGSLIEACAGPFDSAQQLSVRTFLQQNKKEYGILLNQTSFGTKTVTVMLNKVKPDISCLFIDSFSQLLHQLGFSHGCSVCGTPGDYPYSSTEEGISMICEPCFQEHQSKLENVMQEREFTGSYFSGAVGAFFGALIGVIPWMIIGMLGYLAAVCGFVMAWLAFKGYKLMNGKFGKGAIVILVIVLLVMTPVAVLASNMAVAAQDGALGYLDNNIFYLAAAFFLIPELLRPLLGEFALGLLFTALGAFSFLRKVNRTTTGKDLEMVRM